MKYLKKQVQFRYYEAPPDCHVLGILGEDWIREYGNDIDVLHFHNYLELGYCKFGGGTVNYNGEKIPYEKGSFTIIPPNYLHHTNSHVGHKCHWEFLFINVEDILQNQFPDSIYLRTHIINNIFKNALVLEHSKYPEIANMILIIMEELRLKSKFYKESVKGLLQSLMVSLARLFESDVNSIESDENLDVISVAMEYVAKHFQEKITISTLAELCHLSETHFRRIFSQTMNISPQAYINRIRIEAVCKLLHTTNKPISEIAIKCGFITPSTLNRNFKEITGMTPVLFRRDHHYYHNKLKDSKILSYEGWR